MKNRCLAGLLVAGLLSGCATTPENPASDPGNSAPAPVSAAPVPAHSPQPIEFKDGSVVVGTVVKEEAGKLHIQTEFLGAVVIDAAAQGRRVASLNPQRMIVLKNKSRLVGTIKKEEGGKVYFEADLLGLVILDATSVVRREP